MGKAFRHGWTVVSIKATGNMTKPMGKAGLFIRTEKSTKASGSTTKQMAMGSISTLTAPSIADNGGTTNSMAKGSKLGWMEQNTKDSMRMEPNTELDSLIEQTGLVIKDTFVTII